MSGGQNLNILESIAKISFHYKRVTPVQIFFRDLSVFLHCSNEVGERDIINQPSYQ